MQLIDATDALSGKIRPTLFQQGEHGRLVLGLYDLCAPVECGDTRGNRRVDDIVLAAPSTREFTHTRGRCRRYINHLLTTFEKSLSEVATQPLRVLDSPSPIRELACPAQQFSIASEAGTDSK